jgi:aminoglycoside phosphotransferase (APT) family kinase protein
VGAGGVRARPGRLEPEALSEFLSGALGSGRPVAVSGLQRLKGGYSREMWSFDAVLDDDRPSPLVLCADSPTGVVEQGSESLGRVQEATLLSAVGAAGLPVPRVVCSGGAESPLGRAFLVMLRVEGTASVGPLLTAAFDEGRRDAFARQMAQILADLQRLPLPAGVFGDDLPAREEVARRELDRWAGALRKTRVQTRPVLEDAMSWLSEHLAPPPERVVVVHGDYRTGNVMYGPPGVHAVLDWEMAHPGDPLEDVAWAALVCWRIGTGRVGGLVSPDRWLELCQAAAGWSFDRGALRFWEVLAALKIVSLMQRAADAIEPGAEQRLLLRLRDEVEADLASRLVS